MLYRRAASTNLTDTGSERRERTTFGGVARTAFSISALGLTSYSAMGFYMNVRGTWSRYPDRIRKFISAPLPHERTAENLAAKFTEQGGRYTRISNIYQKPQSLLEMTAKYNVPNYEAGKEMLNAAAANEIRYVEGLLRDNEYSQMYLREARAEVESYLSASDLVDIETAEPLLAGKYRRALRKYKSVYDRAERSMGDDEASNRLLVHQDAIDRNRHHYVPVDVDFGEVRFKGIQPTPGVSHPGRIHLGQLLRGAERARLLTWDDRKLFASYPQYRALNMANMETEINKLYGNLNTKLAARAQELMDPSSSVPIRDMYNIDTSLLDYGDGSIGVRFLLKLRNERGPNPYVQGAANRVDWFTEEVIVPLGNRGTIQFGRGGMKYVGALRAEGGEYMTPAAQYTKLLTAESDNIVNGMTLGGRRDWLRNANSMILRRVTTTKGGVTDRGVRLTIENRELMRLNPVHKWEPGEKNGVVRELGRRVKELRDLRHNKVAGGMIVEVKDRIRFLRIQLGQEGIPEQLLELNKYMGKMLDEYGFPVIFHEKSATQGGAFRLASILGYSPFVMEANPQSSIYQFWNVYDIAPKLRTTYPIKYGGKPILPEEAYHTARAFLTPKMYPFNESEVWADTKFYDRVTAPTAKAAGMGERSTIRIPMRDGKLQISSGQPELRALVEELRTLTGDFTRQVDPRKFYGIVRKHNVSIRPRKIISVTPEGTEIRTNQFGAIVTDVTPRGGELVVSMERSGGITNRLRSFFGTARGVMKRTDLNVTMRGVHSNRPLDLVVYGDLTRRVSWHMVEVSVLADAIDELQYEILDINRKLKARPGKYTPTKIAEMRRVKATNLGRLRRAAGIGGATSNTFASAEGMGHAMFPKFHKITSTQADRMMKVLGDVYTEKDMELMMPWWKREGQHWMDSVGKDLRAPRAVMERMTPKVGNARWFGYWQKPDVGRIFGIRFLDLAGIMRQSHEEMVRSYGLKTGVNAGIPFRYTELPFLLHRMMGVPEPLREEAMGAMGQYVAYLTGRLGGKEATGEYLELLKSLTAGELPNAASVIKYGSDEWNTLMRDVIPNMIMPEKTTAAYVTEGGQLIPSTNTTEIARLRAEGAGLTEFPVYKVPQEGLGIFAPGSKWRGKYVELPHNLEFEYGGIQANVRYARIPDPTGLKIKPTTVSGPGGSHTILPGTYSRLFRVLQAMSGEHPEHPMPAGTTRANIGIATRNYKALLDSALGELWEGRKGAARMGTMTAWEPGLKGVVMSMPGKLRWGRKAFDFSGYGPTDIVVSSRAFDDNIREVIYQNMHEKYMDAGYRGAELNRVIEEEVAAIKSGRKWFPTMSTRFPVTGQMARMPARLWFQPKLDKMGEYSKFIFLGELIQKATWGDFDFDQYQLALALHYPGTDALTKLIELGVKSGDDPRIWEGTPAFMYATGQEVYGKGNLIGTYSESIDAVLGGKPRTIQIPKAFRLKPVREGSHDYNIEIHRVKGTKYSIDGKMTNLRYIDGKDMDIWKSRSGKPYILQGGEWQAALRNAIEEGKAPSSLQMELLKTMDPRTAERWTREGLMADISNRWALWQNDQSMGLMMQKSVVGGATAYTMAMNIVAGEELPPEEARLVSNSMASWIQNVALKMKKVEAGKIRGQLEKYGEFTRAMREMRTSSDVYGEILKEAINPHEATARRAVEAIAKIPTSLRRTAFPGAGLPYDIFHRTTNMLSGEKMLEKMIAMWNSPEEQNMVKDYFRTSGLDEFFQSISEFKNASNPMDPRTPTGYFRRKPFIGPIFRRSRIADTMLADSIGKDNTALLKYGLAGAGILGGLYLAFNFFRPNQSEVLGTMPGLGGEFWGPIRGSRMELPRRIPIDVGEYTWKAPPYDRKRARVEMYNPVTAEKLATMPGRVMDALSPVTNWAVAPGANTMYNDYSNNIRPFTIRDAIRSSQVILSR